MYRHTEYDMTICEKSQPYNNYYLIEMYRDRYYHYCDYVAYFTHANSTVVSISDRDPPNGTYQISIKTPNDEWFNACSWKK